MTSQDRIEQALLAEGLVREPPVPGMHHGNASRVWCVTCTQCGETASAAVGPHKPVEAVKQRFSKWVLGRKPRCPVCIGGQRPVSNGQVKNLLTIIAKLEEVWDEAGARYKSGWSDQRVADETAMSLKLVEEIRAERCGPITDPEIERLQGDIGSLRTMLEELSARVENLVARRKIAGH